MFLDAAGGWCWSGYFIVFFVRAVLHGGGRVISPHVTVCARRAVLLLDVVVRVVQVVMFLDDSGGNLEGLLSVLFRLYCFGCYRLGL